MKTKPDIRVLQVGEAETLLALYDACFEEPFGAEAFRALLASPGLWATLAWLRDRGYGTNIPVGFAIARCVADEAEIVSIGVKPSERRRGIGSALLADLMTRAVVLGAKRIFLEVSEKNPAAIDLYTAAGFERVGRRENYYRSKTNGTVAALIMRHTVKKSVS
jgi:ribosomal-protein-alanine N-acetyltransferase